MSRLRVYIMRVYLHKCLERGKFKERERERETLQRNKGQRGIKWSAGKEEDEEDAENDQLHNSVYINSIGLLNSMLCLYSSHQL